MSNGKLVERWANQIGSDQKTTNALTAFAFNSNSIRVIDQDGRPWFVAVDLYRILYGCTTGGGTSAARLLLDSDEQRVVLKPKVTSPNDLTPLFDRGQWRLLLISESGLYKLVMNSRKPEAKPS